jgi:hypothetical protein
MNKRLLQDLIGEVKARYAALKRIWKPYDRIIFTFSIPALISAFVINTGSFTLIVVGYIALVCAVLTAPPFAGTYLLGLRALALLADLLLVSFVSFIVWTTHPEFQMDHQGQVLMVTLWATFFYFVLFDWRFKGTLGKKLCRLKVVPTGNGIIDSLGEKLFRLLGIRVAPNNSKIDFWKSFIRVFATFALPVMLGSYLQEKIVGDDNSRIRFFLGSGLGDAIIVFIPMSIIFFGGNQSIADKLVGISVQRRRQRLTATQNTWVLWVRQNTWTLLICSTLAWSFLWTSLWYLGVWRTARFGISEKPLAEYVGQFQSIEQDPESMGKLWTLLPIGLREPTSILRNIQTFDVSPNPFSFPLDSRTRAPLNPEPYFVQLKRVRLVRITLAPHVSSLMKLVVISNFLNIGAQGTPINQRPRFILLQLTSEQRFGMLYPRTEENILLCWMRSGNNTIEFPAEVRPTVTYAFPLIGSTDEISLLLLGHTDFVLSSF